MSKKFTISADNFKGEDFNCMMASGGGRRLWVTYKDGKTYFKLENFKKDSEITEFTYIDDAIDSFNEI